MVSRSPPAPTSPVGRRRHLPFTRGPKTARHPLTNTGPAVELAFRTASHLNAPQLHAYSRSGTRAVSAMSKRIQILVIEDNRLLRDGLAALLDSQGEFKVVASAEGASMALQRLQAHKPNVVLVDAALGRNCSHCLVESLK